MAQVEPESLHVGDSATWSRAVSGYSASDGWQLEYVLVSEFQRYTLSSADDGSGAHKVNLLAADSADWLPGQYSWQARVSKGLDRHTLASGSITVKPDFSQPQDTRSHVKKVLDAIEAVIEKRATTDQLSYSIAGRSLSLMAPEQLITLRDRYKQAYKDELNAEKIANGGQVGGKIRTRFV